MDRSQSLADNQKLVGLVVFLSSGAVIIGSIGPWSSDAASGAINRVSGLDTNGGFTLVLGIVAALGMISQYWRGYVHRLVAMLVALIFGLTIAVGLYEWQAIDGQVEWGLYAILAGGIVGVLASLYQMIRPTP